MKRITILAIFTFLVVLVSPAMVMSGPPKPVVVTNTPLIVRDINNQEMTPIRATVYTTAGTGIIYKVPPGYRLVIEYINAHVENGDFQVLRLAAGISGYPLTVLHLFIPRVRLDLDRPVGVISEPVKIWFDAEEDELSVGAGLQVDGGGGDGVVSIFGYLVALPSN
jgi:hypothetical protein